MNTRPIPVNCAHIPLANAAHMTKPKVKAQKDHVESLCMLRVWIRGGWEVVKNNLIHHTQDSDVYSEASSGRAAGQKLMVSSVDLELREI